MKALYNSPFNANSTIVIAEVDENWDTAYATWLTGKNPTGSPEWKKGVYCGVFTSQVANPAH